ncbi:MAG: hypothetical protein ACFWUC_04575 [Oscillospiraceae bacterium]
MHLYATFGKELVVHIFNLASLPKYKGFFNTFIRLENAKSKKETGEKSDGVFKKNQLCCGHSWAAEAKDGVNNCPICIVVLQNITLIFQKGLDFFSAIQYNSKAVIHSRFYSMYVSFTL